MAERRNAKCHCGAVAFTVELTDGLNTARRCFNTGTARHFFCSVCGIYTFHQRRSNPNEYGVNVACFENVSPFDFPEVKVMDGVNHPMDGESGVFGYLSFREKGEEQA